MLKVNAVCNKKSNTTTAASSSASIAQHRKRCHAIVKKIATTKTAAAALKQLLPVKHNLPQKRQKTAIASTGNTAPQTKLVDVNRKRIKSSSESKEVVDTVAVKRIKTATKTTTTTTKRKVLKKRSKSSNEVDVLPLSAIDDFPLLDNKNKHKKVREISVITKVYSIPRSRLSEQEWTRHKKALTLVPKERYRGGSSHYKSKAKRAFNLWGEPAYVPGECHYYCVPIQYGLEHFGPADEDHRKQGTSIDVIFLKALWKGNRAVPEPDPFDQEEVGIATASHFAKEKKGGVIEMPTSSGKTLFMTYIITQQLKQKALIVVPRKALLGQTIRRLKGYCKTIRIGIIQGSNFDIEDKDVVVGMLNTLAQRDFKPDAFDSFGVVLFDEVQSVATRHFSRAVYKLAHIPHLIGLSATAKREQDGMDSLFPLFLGPWIFRAPPDTAMTKLTCVQSVFYDQGDQKMIMQRHDPTMPDTGAMVKRMLYSDPIRHRHTMKLVLKLLDEGRNVGVLVEGVKYGAKLIEDLKKVKKDLTMIHYKQSLKEKQREYVDDNVHRVIVATYSMFGVGMDVGYLDTLILLSPRRSVMQVIGRLRSFGQGFARKIALLIDFVDDFGCFLGQHQARIRIYRKRKHRFLPDVLLSDEADWNNIADIPALTSKRDIRSLFSTASTSSTASTASLKQRKRTKITASAEETTTVSKRQKVQVVNESANADAALVDWLSDAAEELD